MTNIEFEQGTNWQTTKATIWYSYHFKSYLFTQLNFRQWQSAKNSLTDHPGFEPGTFGSLDWQPINWANEWGADEHWFYNHRPSVQPCPLMSSIPWSTERGHSFIHKSFHPNMIWYLPQFLSPHSHSPLRQMLWYIKRNIQGLCHLYISNSMHGSHNHFLNTLSDFIHKVYIIIWFYFENQEHSCGL